MLTFEEGVGAGRAKPHFVAFTGNPPGDSEEAATVWEGAARPWHLRNQGRRARPIEPESAEGPSSRWDENDLWVQPWRC